MTPVVHIKTGKIYLILDDALDTTNTESDKQMILYTNLDGMKFVRESKEFYEKFKIVDSCDIYHFDKKQLYNYDELNHKWVLPMAYMDLFPNLEKEI